MELLARAEFPARVHLIGHLVRDICNRLNDFLGSVERKRVDYKAELDRIQKAWEEECGPKHSASATPGPEEGRMLGANAAAAVEALIKKHQRRQENEDVVFAMFVSVAGADETQRHNLVPIARRFCAVHDFFLTLTHLPKEPLQFSEDELVDEFQRFEQITVSLVRGFFETADEISELLQEANARPYKRPPPAQIDQAIASMVSPQHCWMFFRKLENPRWVEPLDQEGCFQFSPKTVGQGDGSHPPWPPSEYLARMASSVPEEVLTALQPIKTTNARVISDIVQAALHMPGPLAAELSQKVITAINADAWVQLYAETAAKLIAKLAADGELDAAFALAGGLFSFRPDKSSISDLVARIDDYNFGELLPDALKALGTADHKRAMLWGCRLLRRAVLSGQSPELSEDFDDMSYIWRPAIEDHEQNRRSGVCNAIVTAVRDLSERVVRDDLWPLRHTVEYLEEYKKLILSRIGLNVVRLCAEKDPELARARMLDRSLFDSYHFRHECAMLLRDRFGMLSPGDQSVILGWINEGLDRDETRNSLQANLGDRFSEESVERSVRIWQRDRLSWFSQSLPPKWKQRYEDLVQEFGEPEHTDLLLHTGAGWGPEAPKKAEELAQMATDDLVGFLRTWRPDPDDPMGPQIRDQASQFGAAVNRDPELFAPSAPAFSDLHPTYVSRFLNECVIAVQNERDVPFRPLVELCLKVVAKPLGLAPKHRVGGDDFDSDQS